MKAIKGEMKMKKGIIIAIVLAIIAPWILMAIFLTLLTPINWTQMTGGFPQMLAILSFSSIAFAADIPIFGYGYLIPLFIWIITGILVGLCCKSVKTGAVLTLLGLLIQVLLVALLTTVNPTFIPAFLYNSENVGLIGGFSLDFLIQVGLFLFWWALVVPGGLLGGIMGGLISRSSIS
jgi:hypothetical protein